MQNEVVWFDYNWANPIFSPSSPSLVQHLSLAGGFSRARRGCVPFQSGDGSEMPHCPGRPFVFPPLDQLPFQLTAAYAVCEHAGVQSWHLPTVLPDLKSSGKRWTNVFQVSNVNLSCRCGEMFGYDIADTWRIQLDGPKEKRRVKHISAVYNLMSWHRC